MKKKIRLNEQNLFQNIWILSLDKQTVTNSFQNNIQHLKIRKYYKIERISLNENNNLLNHQSMLSSIDLLLMME
jgi:hypothetical protein